MKPLVDTASIWVVHGYELQKTCNRSHLPHTIMLNLSTALHYPLKFWALKCGPFPYRWLGVSKLSQKWNSKALGKLVESVCRFLVFSIIIKEYLLLKNNTKQQEPLKGSCLWWLAAHWARHSWFFSFQLFYLLQIPRTVLSTFLMLQSFNAVPHVLVTPQL